MNAPVEHPVKIHSRLPRPDHQPSPPAPQSIPPLVQRLSAECRGDVLFDVASRGRYATDASIYQIFPIGVVVPRDEADARTALVDRARSRRRGLAARRRIVAMRADASAKRWSSITASR